MCDRCGRKFPYQHLREEWNGLKVCAVCFEPKHPQIDPAYRPGDRVALRDPRVDTDVDALWAILIEESVDNDTWLATFEGTFLYLLQEDGVGKIKL